jgi:hypothetical protein
MIIQLAAIPVDGVTCVDLVVCVVTEVVVLTVDAFDVKNNKFNVVSSVIHASHTFSPQLVG